MKILQRINHYPLPLRIMVRTTCNDMSASMALGRIDATLRNMRADFPEMHERIATMECKVQGKIQSLISASQRAAEGARLDSIILRAVDLLPIMVLLAEERIRISNMLNRNAFLQALARAYRITETLVTDSDEEE